MALDIDSFLDKFDNQIKKDNKVNLDFQKDVENKIEKIEKDAVSDDLKDIDLLNEIYNTIKQFDKDLPNKFLGIENKSGIALKNIGDKYSTQFLNYNINNSKVVEEEVGKELNNINQMLIDNRFSDLFKSFNKIKSMINKYPNVLLQDKLKLLHRVKKIEIQSMDKFEIYKKEKILEIRNKLSILVGNLKKSLIKANVELIEKSLFELRSFMSLIPSSIVSFLIDEKNKVNKIIIVSEEHLLNFYKRDYNYRFNVINVLIEKFHANMVKRKLKTCVLLYNEILIEFSKMPEVFLEEKMQMYNKINNLYSQLNQLMIQENVDMFLNSYGYSKKIEATREYLKHVKESQKVNPDNLKALIEEVENLPINFNEEQNEIGINLKEIKNSLTKLEKVDVKNKNIDKSKRVLSMQNEINVGKKIDNIDIDNKSKNIIIPSIESNNNFVKKEQIKRSHDNKINISIVKEIEIYFDRLKKTQDIAEAKKLYDKIKFYLNLVRLPQYKKDKIYQKVRVVFDLKNS